MDQARMIIYLDNLRAGHAYLELLKPDETEGEVYGYYPEKFDEKREVLLGKGQVRKDRSRLEDNRADDDIRQTAKEIELDEKAYQRTLDYLEKQTNDPHFYYFVGYNCIDFLGDVYEVATEQPKQTFLELYTEEELKELSWVGVYARLLKRIP